MNNTECNMKGCIGRMILSVILVFIFLLASGYLVHHRWLMPIYEQTAALWRPMDEMKAMMPWMFGYYAVLSILISALFCKIKKAKIQACASGASEGDYRVGGKHCPIKCGICFGITVGLLIGVVNAAAWIWMPIPGELAVKWIIAWVLQGIGAGLILSFICRKKGA